MGYKKGDILQTDGYGVLYFVQYYGLYGMFCAENENDCKNGLGHIYPLSIVLDAIGNIYED